MLRKGWNQLQLLLHRGSSFLLPDSLRAQTVASSYLQRKSEGQVSCDALLQRIPRKSFKAVGPSDSDPLPFKVADAGNGNRAFGAKSVSAQQQNLGWNNL